MLMESVCDSWPRCRKNHTALTEAAEAASAAAAEKYGYNPWDIAPVTKDMLLQNLLLDCASWLDNDALLEDEGLPDLHFHVAGADGKKKTLTIPSSDYIMSLNQ